MRIMALDVGTKTIGIALSDPLGWTAQGLEVIGRRKPEDDLARLREIIDRFTVTEIVVGLPKNMDGTLGPKAQEILGFVEVLQENTGLPVTTWDERLSTVAAEKTLLEADLSRGKRKKVIDKMAAVMILQGYLSSKKQV